MNLICANTETFESHFLNSKLPCENSFLDCCLNLSTSLNMHPLTYLIINIYIISNELNICETEERSGKSGYFNHSRVLIFEPIKV